MFRFAPALAVGVALACSPALAQADVTGNAQQSANIQPMPGYQLDSKQTRTVYCHMRDTGFNRVTLNIPLYQKSVKATKVERRKAGPGTSATPSDKQLRTAIKAARKCGLKVVLKPHIELPGGEWRSHVTFTNKQNRQADAWAKSWRGWMVKYAKIGRQEKASGLVIGTEQFGTTLNRYNKHNSKRWIATVKAVRKAGFKGDVTYAAYFGSSSRPRETLLLDRKFVRSLTYLGVTYYPARFETGSIAELTTVMRADRAKYFDKMRKRYGRKIVILETGLKTTNAALQSRWYEALLTSLNEIPYVKGVHVYRMPSTPWNEAGPRWWSGAVEWRVGRWFR